MVHRTDEASGLITPTAMERVMQVAYTVKLNSGCISRQVGAVVTDGDNSIKSVGWNDVANGQIPCSMRSLDGLMNDFDEKRTVIMREIIVLSELKLMRNS